MSDNKPLCVFGVLKTETGLRIKQEMLSWLNPLYNVLCIEQDPPGTMFEYPAIKYALKLSIEMNEPVLYIHTKGAAHKNMKYYSQDKIRKLWKMYFGNENTIKSIFNIFENTEEPLVICHFTGKTKATWFNSFFINPSAAKMVNLKEPNKVQRYYYEQGIFKNSDINVYGLLRNDCDNSDIMTKVINEI